MLPSYTFAKFSFFLPSVGLFEMRENHRRLFSQIFPASLYLAVSAAAAHSRATSETELPPSKEALRDRATSEYLAKRGHRAAEVRSGRGGMAQNAIYGGGTASTRPTGNGGRDNGEAHDDDVSLSTAAQVEKQRARSEMERRDEFCAAESATAGRDEHNENLDGF